MSWFAVDDRFHQHAKVSRLRRSPHYAAALAVWTLAGSWAAGDAKARYLGRVPLYVLEDFRVPGTDGAVDALVEVGLWTCDGEAVAFHDWEYWNGVEARHHRSAEQARVRNHAMRLRRCEEGKHDRHCPTTDLDGQVRACPRRAAREAPDNAGDGGLRNPGSGRVGTGRDGSGSGAVTTGDVERDEPQPWADGEGRAS